jgi:hypothetical protein
MRAVDRLRQEKVELRIKVARSNSIVGPFLPHWAPGQLSLEQVRKIGKAILY